MEESDGDDTEGTLNDIESDEDPDFLPSSEDDECSDTFIPTNTTNQPSTSAQGTFSSQSDSEEMTVNEDDIYQAEHVLAEEGILRKGMIFTDKDQVVDAIRRYCLRQQQEYAVEESRKDTITLVCKRKALTGCGWRCKATRRLLRGRKWEIMQFVSQHNCLVTEIKTDHAQLTSAFISREVEEQVRVDPTVKVTVLAVQIKSKYGFQPSYRKTWEAKEKAIGKLHGDWDDSYRQLPIYLNALRAVNPGTVFEFMNLGTSVDGYSVLWTEFDTFHRVFWSFKPCIDGFKFCRPVLLIDATFLYGKYQGNLLIASAVDGGNHILPVAFAVVEKETEDSWEWFLANVKKHITSSRRICIISDRNQGIKNVMDQNMVWDANEGVHHRFCLRHIGANVKKRSGIAGMLSTTYAIGSQYQERKFRDMMNKLASDFPDVVNYLTEIPLDQWTATYDGGFRFGIMSTNTAECMNGILKAVRHLPITAIVKGTFERVVRYCNKNRNEYARDAADGLRFPKKLQQLFDRRIRKAGFHHMETFSHRTKIYSVRTGYNVGTGRGGNIQIVNLSEKTCSCGKFQGRKLPCSHVMAACRMLSLDWTVYVGRWYFLDFCSRVYEADHHPVPHEAYWPQYVGRPLHPNNERLRRIKGRPRSSRYRNEMDEREAPSRPIMCSVCHQLGHNRRTCSQRIR